jgi:hypothetical protein
MQSHHRFCPDAAATGVEGGGGAMRTLFLVRDEAGAQHLQSHALEGIAHSSCICTRS